MGKRIIKSYVFFILLIMILTGQFVVKAQGGSSASVIYKALDDEKTKRFIKGNKALLESLQAQNKAIRYSLEAYQEYPFQLEGVKGDQVGIFPQMIQLFEQLTQVDFQQVSEAGTKEDMMESVGAGDIRLLLGLTMSKQAKTDLTTKYKKCKFVTLEGELFLDPFVLIGRVQEEAYLKESLPFYYWGCLEDQYVELAQTELMNHTVTYNSVKDLVAAFDEGTIQGLFITKGLERFYLSFEQLNYTMIQDVSLEANKFYCIAKNDKVLDKLLPKMIRLYLSLYDEYFLKEIPAQQALPKESELWLLRYLPVLAIGAFVIALFSGFLYFIIRHRENKKMLQILKQLPNKLPKEQEVLFVLLKRSKIRSKQRFQVFGLEQKHPKKSMHMQELTKRIGFDFKKHYAFLVKKQEKEFSSCFNLYIRGVLYTYEESGIYQDGVIVSKIYRKDKIE